MTTIDWTGLDYEGRRAAWAEEEARRDRERARLEESLAPELFTLVEGCPSCDVCGALVPAARVGLHRSVCGEGA